MAGWAAGWVAGLVLVLPARAENAGWREYFREDPTEFHDMPLAWEAGGGTVPAWLGGTYVRNGPAQLSFEGNPRRKFTSWLDGFAKLHSFKFNGAKVLYSGKMLESPNYLASVAQGELVPSLTLNKFSSLEEEWSWGEKLTILKNSLMMTAYDNNNPGLWRIGPDNKEDGIYLGVTDTPVPIRFNLSSLATLGMQYPPLLPLPVTGCTHWMRELGTDNSINFQQKVGLTGGQYVEVHRYRPEDQYGAPQVVATFVARKQSSIHSFSITQNFAIFFFYPVIIDGKKMWGANFHVFELLQWLEDERTEIFVVDLRTGEVRKYQTDPTYSAHHANAYEDGDELVVDLCPTHYEALRTYLDLENQLNPPAISKGSTTASQHFSRYRINTATAAVTTASFPNTLGSRFINSFDFPTINENFRGVAYCVVYGWSAIDYSRMALVKKNVCDSTQDKVHYLENHYSSEMHFLPRPGGRAEDDGALVTIVFDGEKEKSYLLLLDAASFQPIDRAYLPHNIPWSAHGMHFPEAQFPASTFPTG
jgi:carotenoid cleavage dioxygenase-like enzyme